MDEILLDINNRVATLTLNRPEIHNAFDDRLLEAMQVFLEEAIADPSVKVILIRAEGRNFCAGADLNWMQKMAGFNEEENRADARILAKVMYTLYNSPKPTIARVQGAAYGGGVGVIAACDFAIAAENARFCFSEINLGLIPAVISPYVVKAIGERAAKAYFMSGKIFKADEALRLGLVQQLIAPEHLDEALALELTTLTKLPAKALTACKNLVTAVAHQAIDESLVEMTAQLIARQRSSAEAKIGLSAFLNKTIAVWD